MTALGRLFEQEGISTMIGTDIRNTAARSVSGEPLKEDKKGTAGSRLSAFSRSRLRTWAVIQSRTSDPNPVGTSVTESFTPEQAKETHGAQVAEDFVEEVIGVLVLAHQILSSADNSIRRNQYFKKRAISFMAKVNEELNAPDPKEIMGKRSLIENEIDALCLAIAALEYGDQTFAAPSSVESASIQRTDPDEDRVKDAGNLQAVQKAREKRRVEDFVGKTERILEYVSFVLEYAPNDVGDNNNLKARGREKAEELKKALTTLKTLKALNPKEDGCAFIDESLDYLLTEILNLTNGDQASASRFSVERAPTQRAEAAEESVEGSEQIQAAQKAREAPSVNA